MLALSPAALAGGESYRLVTPNIYGGVTWPNCLGFVVVTTDGAPTGCTPWPVDVVPLNGDYSAAADGSIVFMATDNTSGADEGSIWLVKPDGTAVHLDDSVSDFDPTISFDGSKVVFARADPTTWGSDIYSVNSDGSDLKLVVSGGGTNSLTEPAISPDGSTIAYWCAGTGCGPLPDGSNRPYGVMRSKVDGSDPRMIVIGPGLADETAGGGSLSWSPDAQWLTMSGDGPSTNGNHNVFAYRTDGSDLFNNLDPTRQLTHETDLGGAAFPQFSPDGTQILYMKFIDDNGNEGNFAYMIGVDGTDRRELPIPYGEFIPTAAPVAPPPLVDAMQVPVPSVHSLRIAAARSRLAAHHLRVGKVRHVFSAKVRKNRVLSQRPRAGAVAHRTQKLGPRVSLVVSRGRRPRR